MFEDRKMERMNYEEECHEANKAKHNKESRKWSDRPADAWWAHRPGHVAQPREQSAARLFTTQREYLKPERYNVYSDAEPDPFKAEHHAKKERDDDETPTNVAKINQYPREEFVANLKNMRGKETNFTDYQLYFRDGIRDQVAGVESALEDEPLYSSFTANNQFDPNLWLPPHMQKYGRGGGGKDDDLASEISSTELASLQSGASSIAGSLDGGKPRARPDSAKPELNDRTVVATPAVSKGYKQRPATSVPNKRGGVAPLKQGGKQARPWTSGGSRDIQRGAKPNSLVQTLSLPSGGRIRPQSGVRTGGWQLLDTTIPISAPSITPNI